MKKEIKNYVFLKNGDFDRNLDFFALALPTHVSDPFLSVLFNYCRISVRLPDLNRLACTSVGGASLELPLRQTGQSHDVAHDAWQRPYSERPWTYSLRS